MNNWTRLLLQCCHSRHGAVAVPGKMVGLALEGLDLGVFGLRKAETGAGTEKRKGRSPQTPTLFRLALARALPLALLSETPQIGGDIGDALLGQAHLGWREHERAVEVLLFLDAIAGNRLHETAH